MKKGICVYMRLGNYKEGVWFGLECDTHKGSVLLLLPVQNTRASRGITTQNRKRSPALYQYALKLIKSAA